MSVEQAEIIEGIRAKIQAVKTRLLEQTEENDQLRQRFDDLRSELQQKQSLIDELEQKNQKLSLVKGIVAEDDNQDARIHINRIVREIDKCIALLNR